VLCVILFDIKNRAKLLIIVPIGAALIIGGSSLQSYADHEARLALPSMDIKACTPTGTSCTAATDIIRITPKADGSLYLEPRDNDWMLGIYTDPEQTDVTINYIQGCHGDTMTQQVDGNAVTYTACPGYIFAPTS
jgi:hypothetical protein